LVNILALTNIARTYERIPKTAGTKLFGLFNSADFISRFSNATIIKNITAISIIRQGLN
jgi:hypothetical protein